MKDLHDNENIFSMSGHLTKEQLVQYHLGQILKEERYELEKHLVDCELCKDALSGMALMPGYKGIDKIRKDIRKIARPKPGIMNQVAWRNVIISASVLSLVILATLSYIYFTGTAKISKDINPLSSANPPQRTIVPVQTNSSVAIENKKETNSAIDSSDPSLPGERRSATTENKNSLNRTEKIELLKPKSSNGVDEKFKKNENGKLKYLFLPTYYIEDLKIVDYSEKYSTRPSILSKFETGVRAQFKDKAQQADALNEKENETQEITYKSFLEDALVNYKNKNYNDALDKLNLISHYFPNDLNALFYSGLCHYQLGHLNLALSNFAASAKKRNNPLYEEAKWYEALTEIKQNKIAEAKQLLIQIADEDGFYKEQAQNKLAELK